MPFAAAVSTHPVTAHATGEALGQILEGVGPFPDLVVLFVTPGHAGALEDVVAAVHTVLSPTLLIGAVAGAPAGPGGHQHGNQHGHQQPELVLWAGVLGPVAPLRMDHTGLGTPWPTAFAPQGIVVLADPVGFPMDDWLDAVAVDQPGLPVVGTLPGGGPLLLGRNRFRGGAVGAIVGPAAGFAAHTAALARPIGDSLVVTRSGEDVIYELEGIPALQRLQTLTRDQLPAADLHLVDESLHLGSGHPGSPFPLRRVLGADRRSGAIAIEPGRLWRPSIEPGRLWRPSIEPGGPDALVQFFVRDPTWAQQALEDVLAPTVTSATLLFADADAGAGDQRPPAGCVGTGVIGPAGGSNGRHPLAVSLVTFAG